MDTWIPTPTVLLYRIEGPARRRMVRAYLDQAGIRAVEVPPADWHQPLGTLLELPGFARVPGPFPGGAVEEEMLVMFAFRENMLGDFLQFFRDHGLPSVGLKAMATPTNLQWTSLRLYEELRKERAWFAARKPKEKL